MEKNTIENNTQEDVNIFKDKNFLLYFLGMLVTQIGNQIYSFGISWYILRLTQSSLQAGTYLAFTAVLSLILSNFGAAIVDRLDKVKIMYYTDFIRGILMLCASYVIYMYDDQTVILLTLYAAGFFIVLFGSLFDPATQTLVKYMVPEHKLQQANSYLGIKNQLQSIIGMALAGFIYAFVGVFGIFIINGVSYIVSGITELFIRVKSKEEVEGKITFDQICIDIVEGWKYIYNKKVIFRMMLISVFLNFPFALLFSSGLPYLFNVTLKLEAFYLSNVQVVMSVAMIVMMVFLSNMKQPDKYYNNLRKYLLWTSFFFLIAIFVVALMDMQIYPFMYTYIAFIVAMALMGMANAGLNVPMQTFFVKSFDKEMFARSTAVIGIMSSISYPIAAFSGGLIIDLFGLMYVIVISVIIFIICLLWFLVEKGIKEI